MLYRQWCAVKATILYPNVTCVKDNEAGYLQQVLPIPTLESYTIRSTTLYLLAREYEEIKIEAQNLPTLRLAMPPEKPSLLA